LAYEGRQLLELKWILVIATPFKRAYKKLDKITMEKANEIIKMLLESYNPLSLGSPKKGRLRGCYGIAVSSDCRILYTISWKENKLFLLRICSHKKVYG
jgi:addiction module RelE/StbE family toxin